ncbi:hypothetical protein BC830DRAFT_178540 [Chytriomyces sp. MP71]|nr:hypothetical protein BC830DRAFT_178540 [Chytriomyces sp. MP71]
MKWVSSLLFGSTAIAPPATFDAEKTAVAPLAAPMDELRLLLAKGRVVAPTDDEYATLRIGFNWDCVGHPSAIAMIASEDEVAKVLSFAAKYQIKVGVSAGRHSHYASISNVLMIDLRELKQVTVDTEVRSVTVQAGAKLLDLDAACAPHNLATPAGTNPDTGVAGLALGGGVGWLSRKFGLTIDNLISARVALFNGNIVTASESEEKDLFWAIRGGGGNFGVVTEFTLRLHPIPPLLYAGAFVYLPLSFLPMLSLQPDLATAMKLNRDFANTLDNDWYSVMVLTRNAPLIAAYSYAGPDHDLAKKILAASPTRALIKDFKPQTYHTGVQRLAQGPDGKGQSHGYWFEKSLLLNDLPDAVIDILVRQSANAPSLTGTEIVVQQMDGAVARVPLDATAYAHRGARYWVMVLAQFDGSAEMRGLAVEWARETTRLLSEFRVGSYQAVGTQHDNEMKTSGSALVFGSNYARLQEVKRRFDSSNLLCFNQNVVPAESTS